jgi:Ca-activated chloride channel family protein
VHLAITLRSNERAPESRPTVAVHLVMDTSGSMSGQAIEQARAAAARLVELLEPGDRFSLVSYNSGASLVVTEGPVGPRRGSILRQVSQIRAGGGTNLSSGLQMGYGQATASRSIRDSVQLVIVLSDGRANQGVTEPSALSDMAAAAFQGGIETTSIGVGDDYDPMVMSTLAEYGAGGYYYLPDASAIDQVLRAELEVRSRPVARAVELRVRLGEGVELLQAYGSRRLTELEASRVRAAEVAIDHQTAHRDGIATDRQEDREGGMRFFIPGFARNDQHTILVRLRVPSGQTGSELRLADVELRYKDRILRQNGGDERSVRVPYAASQGRALGSQDRRVRRAVLSFRTGEALAQVSGYVASGQQPQALALLHERSELLRAASRELGDGALRAEAERLDAFRSMLASQGIGNRLMLGAIVRRASSGLMR